MPKVITLPGPPGYGRIEALDKKKHAGLGLRAEANFAWTATINAAFVSASEIPRAGLDYPIAFMRSDNNGEYIPVAVLGMESQQNLFVDARGAWRAHCYVPACFRRHPFCLADIPSDDGSEARHIICVEENRMVASENPLFDGEGTPTPAWAPIQKLLESIEASRQQTRVLMRRLEALELLSPFDAIAVPRTGKKLRLQGLFRVDEKKLQDIPGKDLRTFLKKGELRCIYAHLISLENFARVLDLAAERRN